MIYNENYETLSREDLEQLQIERLQSTLNRVYRNVAFYRGIFDREKIRIEAIKEISHLSTLPFTTREDLRSSYPYDMFAVPLRDIVRIHSSRGKTGKPIAVGYTRNDLNNWSELTARTLIAAGVTDHDFMQIAFDYNMFTGGFGIHYGAEKIGASVIPSSSQSNIQKQIMIMKDYKTSVLVSSPSHAVKISKALEEMDIHPEELQVRLGIFGAEPWGKKIRGQIEDKLHITAYNIYGVNTIVGPGMSCECEVRDGLHINEDHFIVEIIDPDTLKPVPLGEEGEVVVTTITREGFPLIRYRTGDRSFLIPEKCSCGRTTMKMGNVKSRVDNMLVVGGISFYPEQIEDILVQAGALSNPVYCVILENEEGIDSVEIQVSVSDTMFNDELKKIVELKNKIGKIIENELNLEAKITFVEPDTLSRGMPVVIDRR